MTLLQEKTQSGIQVLYSVADREGASDSHAIALAQRPVTTGIENSTVLDEVAELKNKKGFRKTTHDDGFDITVQSFENGNAMSRDSKGEGQTKHEFLATYINKRSKGMELLIAEFQNANSDLEKLTCFPMEESFVGGHSEIIENFEGSQLKTEYCNAEEADRKDFLYELGFRFRYAITVIHQRNRKCSETSFQFHYFTPQRDRWLIEKVYMPENK